MPSHRLERVRLLVGDVGSDEPDLGLNATDLSLLLESCTHVFHAAAFISFAAPLSLAVRVNLGGSRAVLDLARRMRRLRAMVHVSSAYVNCGRGSEGRLLEERVYPVDVNPVEILNAVRVHTYSQYGTS